jgi:nickel-dependent lactate racemase
MIGSIAYHYFSGWSGGRKMVLPGVAHIDTAWANHRLTLTTRGDMSPDCGNGKLDGNPVHEDMVEAAGMIENSFMINAVLDGWARVVDVVSGGMDASHREAVERARAVLDFDVDRRCDLAIVSAGGHPLDLNLIQSHKSIDHAYHIVRDGGVMIAVCACENGMGSDTFMQWFDLGDAVSVCRRLLESYALNGHTALAIMKKLERINIILVSSLPREAVRRTGMLYASDVGEAVAQAQSLLDGAGLTYALSKHVSFALEPRVNYYLNSINDNPDVDFHPYRIGVYTGLQYEF